MNPESEAIVTAVCQECQEQPEDEWRLESRAAALLAADPEYTADSDRGRALRAVRIGLLRRRDRGERER